MTSSSEADLIRPAAHLELFGYEPTSAALKLRPRSRRWRLLRTGQVLAITVVVAPFTALVPPHAPWVLGALAGGVILARGRWKHRFTVVELRGTCPRCGSELTLPGGSRLRSPQPVTCDACRHQPNLRLDEELPSQG